MPKDRTILVLSENSNDIERFSEEPLLPDDAMDSVDRESLLADEEDAVPEVCFGAIVVTVTSISRGSETDRFASVDLEAFGDLVKIRLQDTGKYAGLIRSPTIRQLLDDTAVQLCATLTQSSPVPSQATRTSAQKSTQAMSYDSTVRIVIAGTNQERLRIGKTLSDSSLFLQHPYTEECGDLEYSNPHYLLRPGSAMPKLQELGGLGSPQAVSSRVLSEVNKNRITRTFDVASLDSSQGICLQSFTSPRLKSSLKSHQLKAVAMMVEREGAGPETCKFPSTWETTKFSDRSKRFRNAVTGVYSGHAEPSMGGLLADDMGLGKTLSTLALICLSLDFSNGSECMAHTTLVVTTKSTLPGWQSQINRHIHDDQLRTALYHGSSRHLVIDELHEQDVVLTTYETLRNDFEAKGPLYKRQWHRIVLDEAHHIRNRKSQIFIAVCSVQSTFRWCLTGTPVHNSLDDYGALLSFLRVPSFTSKAMFDHWITTPIQQKKQEGLSRLQILVRTTCLRRTKESIGDALDLPQRREEIDFVTLQPRDQELYDFFKSKAAELALGTTTSNLATATHKPSQDGSVLSLLNFLRLTCNHGQQILPGSALKLWDARDRTLVTRDEDETMVNGDGGSAPVFSAKVLALLKNLRLTHTSSFDSNGRLVVKSVVFSYWTKMLDLIQQALSKYSFGYCRINGSTSLEGRSLALNRFNEDPDCSVMLATIGSAGEGLDLTVANHVHLIEPHWNPMAEAQAVDRVYRIGQRREVTVTRYIVPNSIETYIQWVQQQKLKLVSKIVDTESVTQAEIDTERWKQLRETLGCIT